MISKKKNLHPHFYNVKIHRFKKKQTSKSPRGDVKLDLYQKQR